MHNALLELVHEGRIGRERYRGQHLYVSADAERAAEQVRLEALCDTVRLDIELAGALRWVRRRVPGVHDILTTLKGLLGESFVVVAPTLTAFGIHLGVAEVLVALRGIAAETIRDWLKRYRRGGFEALLPKPRADRGQARHLPPSVVEALLATKEGNPQLSVQLVIRAVRQRPEVPPDLPLPLSTVHRLLARHGLMDSTKTGSETQDRRRFAFAQAGELWMSDVMHGPSVVVGERVKRKTYLIAFIDDATRVIPHAAFCLSENTRSFLPVLEQAILRRGLPQKLFVDNGANYRSKHLALVCAKLGIALIHARPYQPQGKGKIERWFRTVRAQLLTRLTAADVASLTALNRRLAGWVEGEYHHNPMPSGLRRADHLNQDSAGASLPRRGVPQW